MREARRPGGSRMIERMNDYCLLLRNTYAGEHTTKHHLLMYLLFLKGFSFDLLPMWYPNENPFHLFLYMQSFASSSICYSWRAVLLLCFEQLKTFFGGLNGDVWCECWDFKFSSLRNHTLSKRKLCLAWNSLGLEITWNIYFTLIFWRLEGLIFGLKSLCCLRFIQIYSHIFVIGWNYLVDHKLY